MRYGILFTLIAVLLAVTAAIHGGWHLLLLWPAVSFALVALGYFHFGPRVFGKSPGGLLSPVRQFVLLPYLLLLWSAWYILRFVKREPALHQLTEGIFIGRRLLSHELPDDVDHVIDLTCEFSEPKALRSSSYHCFPILDGFVPSPEQLRGWAERTARLPGTLYIHCAEGHGRAGLFTAVLLVHVGHCPTVDDALQFITSKRPLVRLGRRQLAVLRATQEAA